MKTTIFIVTSIILTVLLQNLYAQNGGMNVKNVSASNTILVGTTASEAMELGSGALTLPPLSDEEIDAIPNKRKGMLVFSESADELKFWDGSAWQSVSGSSGSGGSTINVNDFPCEGAVFVDQDGNFFSGVEIDTQCWMDRNLEVKHFPNGDIIPYVEGDFAWGNLASTNSDAAVGFYGDGASSVYGGTYTYAAAIAENWTKDNAEGQGICPDGWHLPTSAEWTTLKSFLVENQGGKLKEANYFHWDSPNTGATNEYGFAALGGGYRDNGSGGFASDRQSGYWWTATDHTTASFAIGVFMSATSASLSILSAGDAKSNGFSIRCVRN